MSSGDQYFDKVVLGLDFESGFTDKSPFGRGLLSFGNVSVSSAQKKFGALSGYFDGTGDYVSVASDTAFGTGDFTVEGWVFVLSPASAFTLFDTRDSDEGNWNGFVLYVRATQKLTFGRGVPFTAVEGTTTISANTWHHVALTRLNGTVRGFLNGVQEFSVTDNSDFSLKKWNIGHMWSVSGTLSAGYIDDLRITKGVARYTSNFTPEQCKFYYAQLEGTVKDAAGNFARRLVRAHRRSDGVVTDETLSNISTGEFALNCTDGSKHYVVVHDSDAWITYLPFNGDNDSTLIYEWGGKQITPYGNAKLSTAQSKFGGSSLYLDGTGDYLSLPMSNDLDFGTGDFTVECWVYISTTGVERAIFDSRAAATDTGLYFCVTSTNQLSAFTNNATIATGTTALTGTTWHHISLVKYAGVVTLYLNGLAVASAASTSVVLCPTNPVLGRKLGSTTNDFSGYIDDLRISKGVARYITNFTPPTAPHDSFSVGGDPHWSNVVLAMKMDGANDSTTFTDLKGNAITPYGDAKISTAQSKFGGASAYFDGNGDYLRLPSSFDSMVNFGASDFTIELWCRPSSFGSQSVLLDPRGAYDYACSWLLLLSATGKPTFTASTTAANSIGGSWNVSLVGLTTLSTSEWTHIAVCRLGSSWVLYVDGVAEASVSVNITVGSADRLSIGAGSNGTPGWGYFFNGYIDDLRITKGVARYISNFTVPTESYPTTPQSQVSNSAAQDGDPYWNNVVLAMHMDGANNSTAFVELSSGRTVTPVGNAKISTAQSKFGGASCYFDGDGDYLSFANHSDLTLTGAFTIDFWVRFAGGLGASQMLYDDETSQEYGFLSNKGASDTIAFSVMPATESNKANSGNLVAVSSTTVVSLDTWYHVAFVGDGTNLVLFINGVSEASAPFSGAVYNPGGPKFFGVRGTYSTNYLNGYLEDLRITKGVARYTANFTPPATPFKDTLQTFGQQNAMIFDYLTPV